MRILPLRTAAIVVAAGLGLGGCATYSPFGYGSGISVGYGNYGGYGSYGGYGNYGGYGSGYYDPYYSGYSPYGYRNSYWGWNGGYYYPGTGYYVYDSGRRPHRWTDSQRRYWTQRRDVVSTADRPRLRENWTDFRRDRRAATRAVRVERRSRDGVRDRDRTVRVERRTQTRSSAVPTRRERVNRRDRRGDRDD